MLRIIQNSSPAGAKSYSSTSDYYTEGQELVGLWRGKGAEALGLSGEIKPEDWAALCDNRDPRTMETLTLRRREERRVGYDFNFHAPKSVSLLYSLTKDERLLDASRESFEATMEDIEAEMKTRVRRNGLNEDRMTGNMVFGEFVHFTARPVGEVPDCHVHAHCFVFNTTWDKAEHAWKAGQFGDIKRDGEFFEAVFHSRLASRLTDLGLEVEWKKWGWELAGLEQAMLDKFLRRTAQIEEEARKKGTLTAEGKAQLGAKTRSKKAKELSFPELQQQWKSRLTADESSALDRLFGTVGSRPRPEDPDAARESIEQAIGHVFERKSVVPERTLLAQSLKRSVGRTGLDSVFRSFEGQDLIRAERKGCRMVTAPEVLAEERKILNYARSGRGRQRRLGTSNWKHKRTWLNDGQQKAVAHVLESRDTVMLIRGAAGPP